MDISNRQSVLSMTCALLKTTSSKPSHKVMNHGPWDKHTHWLNEAAERCDHDKGASARSPQHVNNVVIKELTDDDMSLSFSQWDIDFIANHIPGEKRKKDVWDSLRPAARTVWDTIPAEDKAKILNAAIDRVTRITAKDSAAGSCPPHSPWS